MIIKENFSLKTHHTFRIEVNSRYFVEITSIGELEKFLTHPLFKDLPKLILGEGSNVLFSHDFPGVVLKLALKGIEIIKEDAEYVWIQAAAGEIWHDLVLYCIAHDFAGIENLSLIPGTVGAAPMQNIGAYGVELADSFESLTALRIADNQICVFDHIHCQFGYRESLFKKEGKNQYIILSITLKLNKIPSYHVEYGAIQQTLAAMNVKELSIQNISRAIIQIRQHKLPDPKKIGNAGSFFKNPILSSQAFKNIFSEYPEMPYYLDENGSYKIPAAWFIEQCGWKGHRLGDAGVHENHALVLVNYGNSSGSEIKNLAEKIQISVKNKFNVELLPEVNIF
jgi:UDP-N-acetylmuramate dehydrogenase